MMTWGAVMSNNSTIMGKMKIQFMSFAVIIIGCSAANSDPNIETDNQGLATNAKKSPPPVFVPMGGWNQPDGPSCKSDKDCMKNYSYTNPDLPGGFGAGLWPLDQMHIFCVDAIMFAGDQGDQIVHAGEPDADISGANWRSQGGIPNSIGTCLWQQCAPGVNTSLVSGDGSGTPDVPWCAPFVGYSCILGSCP